MRYYVHSYRPSLFSSCATVVHKTPRDTVILFMKESDILTIYSNTDITVHFHNHYSSFSNRALFIPKFVHSISIMYMR